MRALLVSYAFPPVGGAGVARVLKLAKYLPDHGIEPIVLTAARPSVPVEDPSLWSDVAPDLAIRRAPTLEPGYALKRAAWRRRAGRRPADADTPANHGAPASRGAPALGRAARERLAGAAAAAARGLLVPDPQILWQPAARRALRDLLRDEAPPRAVLISGPPFSQFLLAPLARRLGAAVVLDYRDEWATYRRVYEMSGRVSAIAGPPLERALARRADAVTTATEGFRASLQAAVPGLDPARVETIPNGYDPADLPPELPAPPSDRFVLTYAGTIFRLTRPAGLLAALGRLRARSPELARLLEVRIIGRVVDTEAGALAGAEELGVRVLGYQSKEDAMRELAASHMTLCVLDDAPGAERVHPAKIFELMALGRPCLTLAPPGELAELARRHRPGPLAHPRDDGRIAEILADALDSFRRGTYRAEAASEGVARFDRRAQAAAFAEVLRRAASGRRGAGAARSGAAAESSGGA